MTKVDAMQISGFQEYWRPALSRSDVLWRAFASVGGFFVGAAMTVGLTFAPLLAVGVVSAVFLLIALLEPDMGWRIRSVADASLMIVNARVSGTPKSSDLRIASRAAPRFLYGFYIAALRQRTSNLYVVKPMFRR